MLHILLSLALAPVGPPLADASDLLEANLTMRWQSPSSGNSPKIVTSFDDKTIILIIIGTILLVFILVFSFIPSKDQLNPSIQWKEPYSKGMQVY